MPSRSLDSPVEDDGHSQGVAVKDTRLHQFCLGRMVPGGEEIFFVVSVHGLDPISGTEQ
jgi:hypothetical protein